MAQTKIRNKGLFLLSFLAFFALDTTQAQGGCNVCGAFEADSGKHDVALNDDLKLGASQKTATCGEMIDHVRKWVEDDTDVVASNCRIHQLKYKTQCCSTIPTQQEPEPELVANSVINTECNLCEGTSSLRQDIDNHSFMKHNGVTCAKLYKAMPLWFRQKQIDSEQCQLFQESFSMACCEETGVSAQSIGDPSDYGLTGPVTVEVYTTSNLRGGN